MRKSRTQARTVARDGQGTKRVLVERMDDAPGPLDPPGAKGLQQHLSLLLQHYCCDQPGGEERYQQAEEEEEDHRKSSCD